MAFQICCNAEKTKQIKKAIEEVFPTITLDTENTQNKGCTILMYSMCGMSELLVGLTAMKNGAWSAGKI